MKQFLCKDCTWFDHINHHVGYCRRHAPRPALWDASEGDPFETLAVAWPVVQESDWCAEVDPPADVWEKSVKEKVADDEKANEAAPD